ncbi:hypothetical protein IFR05_007593 [Cadophora sp. M221]|nr:hypothetical protein IFR05_007593 [Cadophora sp. M221]
MDTATEPQVVNPDDSTITTPSDPWSTAYLQSSLQSLNLVFPNHQPSPRLQNLLGQLPQLDLNPKSLTLKEFTFFPQLPLELRQTIWGIEANDHRRFFELSNQNGAIFTPCADVSGIEGRSAQHTIPTILHISHESRAEALRYFTPCYDQWARGTVYINFNNDTLVLDEDCVEVALHRFDQMQWTHHWTHPEQSLVIRRYLLTGMMAFPRSLARMFELLPSMEELTLGGQETFAEGSTANRTQGDEGYFWRELAFEDKGRALIKRHQGLIAKDPKLPACVRKAALKAVVMTTGVYEDRFRFTHSILLEEDLGPVRLVNGEYRDGTLQYTP